MNFANEDPATLINPQRVSRPVAAPPPAARPRLKMMMTLTPDDDNLVSVYLYLWRSELLS